MFPYSLGIKGNWYSIYLDFLRLGPWWDLWYSSFISVGFVILGHLYRFAQVIRDQLPMLKDLIVRRNWFSEQLFTWRSSAAAKAERCDQSDVGLHGSGQCPVLGIYAIASLRIYTHLDKKNWQFAGLAIWFLCEELPSLIKISFFCLIISALVLLQVHK